MQNLTPEGQQLVTTMSQRYNLSHDAIVHMLIAVSNGGGSMAQFNCPELGGGGQWMRGGMTMVGDMFNYGLKNTVDNLCNDLSNALASTQVFPIIPAGTPGSNQWWPQDLGVPFSSGAQNDIKCVSWAFRSHAFWKCDSVRYVGSPNRRCKSAARRGHLTYLQ